MSEELEQKIGTTTAIVFLPHPLPPLPNEKVRDHYKTK